PLKRMLTDPLYIGKPTVEGESIGDDGQKKVLDRPELQLIDEELFKRVNEKIEGIEDRQSSNNKSGEVFDLDYIMHEFGLLPLVESSPHVAIHCRECGSEMVRDGTRVMDDTDQRVPIYTCMNCLNDSGEADSDEDSEGED
ncbi:MAG: hypothetical protein ABEI86_04540, partial [Halobacteriaceae archaeon]